MFYSSYEVNVNDSYKECLVNNLEIYSKNQETYNARLYFGVLTTAIDMANPRDEVYEKFKSLRNYKKYINNTTPAESLESIDPSKIKGFDNYANCIFEDKIKVMDETEVQNIKSGKTLLRVNDKNQVIYTVSKVGDRFVFKNYNLIEGWPGPGYSLKLFLNSVWYVKQQLPSLEAFKEIQPFSSSIYDVMKADPNFRCCEKDGNLYSTHFFAEGNGAVITIKYYKNFQGIYKVENTTQAMDGLNVLPYLLPIDRKLIDPSYTAETEEQNEPETNPKTQAHAPANPYCNIM